MEDDKRPPLTSLEVEQLVKYTESNNEIILLRVYETFGDLARRGKIVLFLF